MSSNDLDAVFAEELKRIAEELKTRLALLPCLTAEQEVDVNIRYLPVGQGVEIIIRIIDVSVVVAAEKPKHKLTAKDYRIDTPVTEEAWQQVLNLFRDGDDGYELFKRLYESNNEPLQLSVAQRLVREGELITCFATLNQRFYKPQLPYRLLEFKSSASLRASDMVKLFVVNLAAKRRAKRITEALTNDDWNSVLALEWELDDLDYLNQLMRNGNNPVELRPPQLATRRQHSINATLKEANLPFRLYVAQHGRWDRLVLWRVRLED